MMTFFKSILTLTLGLLLLGLPAHSQSFEGIITYRVDILNPNPKDIPEQKWQERLKKRLGEKGYITQTYYFKNDQYLIEIESGENNSFLLFDPVSGLLYNWENTTALAMSINTKVSSDKLESISPLDQKEEIMDINCDGIALKSANGYMKVWYNSNYFEVDDNLYSEHIYGHWSQILNKTGSLPLKIETKQSMSHMIQTAIAFEEKEIAIEKFEIPSFGEIIEAPTN